MNAPLAHGAALPLMLTELRLPTIRAQWQSVAEAANRESWPAERFLSTLLDMEMAEREIRRIERHRNESQLPPGKLCSNFDFAAVPSLSKALVMAMTEADAWLEQGGIPPVSRIPLMMRNWQQEVGNGYQGKTKLHVRVQA